MKYDLTYLSLGAGLQSSALLVCSALGTYGCPRADVAIFADTQGEPQWVYDQLAALSSWSAPRGIPVIVVTKGNLAQDVIDRYNPENRRQRFAAVPCFTMTKSGIAGPLKRQCTQEYKIEPIERKVRELLGYSPRQRVKKHSMALIGISLDEAGRLSNSRTKWITKCHPLVDAGLTRNGCRQILKDAGLPVPNKSACVYCPYHDDDYWQMLKSEWPDEFARAVEYDRAFRNMTARGIDQPVFLHRSLKPIDQVEFVPKGRISLPSLFDPVGQECGGCGDSCNSGYCGV